MNTINTEALTLLARVSNRLKAIKELPICQLELRQPMLLEVLVMLVDFETEGGTLTRDVFVRSQEYWPLLVEKASDAGFTVLGAGYFSAAFKHEMLPGKVFKIGFKKEDSGAAYAAYCRANAGTVGLPVIHSLERHKSCYSVVLDEFTSIEDKMHKQSVDVVQQYTIVYECVNQSEGFKGHFLSPNEHHKALADTAKGIREFFHGVSTFDLHDGNVMLDRNGNIVITDPMSFSHGDEMRDCDVDRIIDDIAEIKLKEWAAGRLMKWQKKHPSTEVRAMRKRKVKARRRMKKRTAKRNAQLMHAMLNDPMLDGKVFIQ